MGKQYRIGERERYVALRDVVSRAMTDRFRSSSQRRGSKSAGTMWAVRDVDVEVSTGDVIGIVGRNGAGKTTLLKVLARITRPTTGRAEVRGRVGSLLEVGTGFHPELTGRENIQLSGAILGMSRRTIERQFDEIVEFSGVEAFLDTPLKHFSTGMQTRLAFAVAAHLQPEILLVDEVLAVGDLEFQRKCLGKMEEVSSHGRTVVLVTHQMTQLRRLCSKVLWLDGGRVREFGPTVSVTAAYESAVSQGAATAATASGGGAKASFLSWKIEAPAGTEPNVLSTLGPIVMKLSLQVHRPLERAYHGIALTDNDGQLMWAKERRDLSLAPGITEFRYAFAMLPLRPGVYSWFVSLYDEENEVVDALTCVPQLLVATDSQQHPQDQWCGFLNVPCEITVAHVPRSD